MFYTSLLWQNVEKLLLLQEIAAAENAGQKELGLYGNLISMRFMWDPKYSLSIREIDLQHQKFFEIINSAYYLADKDGLKLTKDRLKKVVDELNTYGEFHMGFEEKYFEEFKYQAMAEHVACHELFRNQVKEFYIKIEKPDVDLRELVNEMAEYSKNWLSEHILNEDHKYVSVFLTNWK